jgi:enterochelin esterase-like enzyme
VAGAPEVSSAGVRFNYRDESKDLRGVALVQEVAWPRSGPEMRHLGGGRWSVDFARPPVDRMEYRFKLTRADGSEELALDPANPLRAPGAFGERSVIEFPEYEPPAWLATSAAVPPGELLELELPAPSLGAAQPTLLWSPAGTAATEALPLLVVLDGLEFARFSSITKMLDVEVAAGVLPPMRALLMQPVARDQDYTASPAFAAALTNEIIPSLAAAVALPADRRLRAGLGASLGGLAMMHAHREHPGLFGALFLQSSSFLHSGQLGGASLERVRTFVNDMLLTGAWRNPIPVTMTCGSVEQNLSNNRDTVAVLCEQGYEAELFVNRDAHNWIGWRDAWTPHLGNLLQKVWQ